MKVKALDKDEKTVKLEKGLEAEREISRKLDEK